MISIPLPLFLTAVAAGLCAMVLTRAWLPPQARAFFATFAIVIMVETVLVVLRFAYQIEPVLVVQRLLPFWVGPTMYLGFLAVSDRSGNMKGAACGHLAVAGAITIVIAAVPQVRPALDLLIGLTYVVYAVLLFALWRGGPDRLSRLAVVHVPKMRRLMVLGAVLLMVTLVMDTVIAIDFARNDGENATTWLSFGSLTLLGLMGAAVFWVSKTQPTTQDDQAADADIVVRASAFLSDSRLFTDPELSLTRLARRIGVTDRALSAAVNRDTGKNVSQFINTFRVAEAAHLLRTTTDPVGRIGEAAGFLTRSNFYTEFQRTHGQSPGAYRKGERET